MGALRAVGRLINRWATQVLVLRLQRLPFYRGQADSVAFDDPLMDPDAQRAARVPASAYEAEWPPHPTHGVARTNERGGSA